MPQTGKLGLTMSSDGNGSSDGRSSKLMGVLEKLGTSGEVRVSACPCIYIYMYISTLGMYRLYICANYVCHVLLAHTYGSKASTIKSSQSESQS